MSNIPERFRAACQFCNLELDTREPGVHQYTKGWVKNRQGGGGHGISLPERENRWAHGYCVERQSEGLFGQVSLFGDDPPPPPVKAAPPPSLTNARFDEAGMLTHKCAVCGNTNAPYGVDVSVQHGRLGVWFCGIHKPQP